MNCIPICPRVPRAGYWTQMLGNPSAVSGRYIDAIWDYAPIQTTGVIVSFGMECSPEPAATSTARSAQIPAH